MIDVIKCFGDCMGQCVLFMQELTLFDSVSLWDVSIGLLVLDLGISLIKFILSSPEGGK